MEIFPFLFFPYDESDRRKEKVKLRVRAGVRVRALHVTSSRDCKTALYSPLSAIACVGFKSSVSFQMGFEEEKAE
jgi:hypothetical protein